MKKRLLVGVTVAALLFAVGAFAASFTDVDAEDIASGNDDVEACADSVLIDFTTSYDNAGDWNVTHAVVKFLNDAGNASDGCEGFTANVVVMTSTIETGGAPAASGSAPIPEDATEISVPLTPGTVKASAVQSAAVLVDGNYLPVTFP